MGRVVHTHGLLVVRAETKNNARRHRSLEPRAEGGGVNRFWGMKMLGNPFSYRKATKKRIRRHIPAHGEPGERGYKAMRQFAKRHRYTLPARRKFV